MERERRLSVSSMKTLNEGGAVLFFFSKDHRGVIKEEKLVFQKGQLTPDEWMETIKDILFKELGKLL